MNNFMLFSPEMQEMLVHAAFKDIETRKMGLISGVFTWMTDSRYRTTQRLDNFIKDQLRNVHLHPEVGKLANKLKGRTNDETVLNVMRWVNKNLRYFSDQVVFGREEYWSTAWETLNKKMGDCDSINTLVAILCILGGVPYWKIFFIIGNVKDPFTGGNSLHFYLCYWSTKYDKLVVVDNTYYIDLTSVANRKPFRLSQPKYRNIIYIWTHEFMFKVA